MTSPVTPSATRVAAGCGVRSSLLPHFRAIEQKPLGSENDIYRRLGKPDHHEPRARTPPVAASRPSSPSDSARALSLLCRTALEKAQTSRTRTPPTPQITAKVAAGRRTPSTVFRATSEINRRQRNWPPLSSPEFASSSAPSAPFSSFDVLSIGVGNYECVLSEYECECE
ncbi:uncharacterized protein LOC128195456 isoform X2 [Vigna angularis]|nr:uncharacterized protein LOC128195456 isoform X2 [Vigna angularis]